MTEQMSIFGAGAKSGPSGGTADKKAQEQKGAAQRPQAPGAQAPGAARPGAAPAADLFGYGGRKEGTGSAMAGTAAGTAAAGTPSAAAGLASAAASTAAAPAGPSAAPAAGGAPPPAGGGPAGGGPSGGGPAGGPPSSGGGGSGGGRRSGGGGAGGGGGGTPSPLHEEARRRYLNYALSVITSRALPDVRDGLKPVQRRILYGMWNDLGLTSEAKQQKSAQVVGLIMGRYHPHGDSSIYDALVRMAQEWSLRYPLVDGHGNFGSIDGDSAAAYRYTECKLQPLAGEILDDLGSATVDYRPSYDGSREEPIVVPARLPQLLMNGATGIAVGMATNIPPHNAVELVEACVALIEDPALEVKDLLKYIRGPDFPTGGQLLNNKAELREIYETGQGSLRVRGEYKLEDLPRGGQQIVLTSIPYAINKSTLVAKIGELVSERKIPLITDVRDESTKDIRVVLELKRDSNVELVMAFLYKHTTLQSNFNVNLTCLVPTENPEVGAPERLNLKRMLEEFLKFRFQVVTRRLQHDLAAVLKRLHVLEGFEKVYDALDEMIKIIRKSDGKADAAGKLQKRFELDAEQVEAILEMKLFKLARLEILVIQKEAEEKRTEQKKIERVLGSEKLRWNSVRDELQESVKHAEGKRRTRIGGAGEEVELADDAFISDEDAHVVITRDGWIKRVREIKDPSTTRLREGDSVTYVLAGSLKQNLVLFSSTGTAYVTRFNDVPASTGYGDPVQKLFKFDDGERVVGALSLDPRLVRPGGLLAVSKHGFGLRFPLLAHTEVSTRSGRRFARPPEGDEIAFITEALPEQLLGVVSEKGHALVCTVAEVNELSGPGKGVTVIKLDEGDQVIALKVADEKRGDHQVIRLESEKGKKVELELRKGEIVARGGRGRELVRKDKLLPGPVELVFVPLPAEGPKQTPLGGLKIDKNDKPEKG